MIEIALPSEQQLTYNEAVLYCRFLEYNGHRDWRMPTWDEYHNDDSIVGWFDGDRWDPNGVQKWRIVPVRDI